MKDLMMFENEVFGSISVVEIDGKIWFAANEVARALGYKDPSRSIRDHVRDKQKTMEVLPAVRGNKIWAINEGGLYRLVFRSKLEGAEAFQDWVTDDILPNIRKTGQYSMADLSPAEILLAQAQRFLEQERKIERLEREKASQAHLDDLDAYARGRYPGFSTNYVKPISAIPN